MWCTLDQGEQSGAFGPRFIVPRALRIGGRLDVAALREALNDLVARHEILRTVVVREADPPHQRVYPPCPVPLELRELPSSTGRPREILAEELIIETEQSTMNARQVPLLRAVLGRFDDRDWVLILVTHHSATDGWSGQLIIRDLAACYAARTAGRSAQLPTARQYREFAAWQQARVSGPEASLPLQYWRDKLRDARIFALPADRPVPPVHTTHYSAGNYAVGGEVMAAVAALARSMRCSTFMVVLAAFNVLAYQITSTTDPVINTLTTGRNEPEFQNTAGPFVNFLPLRTDIGGCASFRDILARTRETCLEAFANEIPIQHIERELPELMQPNEEPGNCDTIVGMFQPQFDGADLLIAESCYQIKKRELAPGSADLPRGIAWNLVVLPSGELTIYLQYNLEDVDERTVSGWASSYQGILARAAAEPDRDWKTL